MISPHPHPELTHNPGEAINGVLPRSSVTNTGAKKYQDHISERILAAPHTVSDDDLLEFLLFHLSRRRAKRVARALLLRFGSFPRVIAAPVWNLLSVEGLSVRAAAVLKSVDLSAVRLVRAEVNNKPLINSWDRLMAYLHAELSREREEQIRILFLDGNYHLLADETQWHGTINHAPVYPREVVKRALELSAVALILVHNHPSGDPTPSAADIEMTGDVEAAVNALSIILHDHVVVGNGPCFSFRGAGLLGRSSSASREQTIPLLGRCNDSCDATFATSPRLGAASSDLKEHISIRQE